MEFLTNIKGFLKIGFELEEQSTTESIRWVKLTKQILIRNTGFKFIFEVVYELSISDSPTATYEENHHYFFEGIKCFLEDEEGERVFTTTPKIETINDFKILEHIFSGKGLI